MQSVVGIFTSRADAENSLHRLLNQGISQQAIIFLTGDAGAAHAKTLPTADAEPEGAGQNRGALVGGAAGVGVGLPLGAAVATFLVPGVGTILGFGLGAAAWLGLGGAAVGAMVGEQAQAKEKEHQGSNTPLTKDDTGFYHGLLKRGRSLVVVHTESETDAFAVRSLFQRLGAQDVETARKDWHEAA
jgi:hypothetical protein